ncbi:hypothetical protein AMTRI_Chr03g146810 [Amborella trichopoda]
MSSLSPHVLPPLKVYSYFFVYIFFLLSSTLFICLFSVFLTLSFSSLPYLVFYLSTFFFYFFPLVALFKKLIFHLFGHHSLRSTRSSLIIVYAFLVFYLFIEYQCSLKRQ